MRVVLLVLAAATADREARHAAQRETIAALTNLSKPFTFHGPDAAPFEAIDKKLKMLEASSEAELASLKGDPKATSFLQASAGAHKMGLKDLHQTLAELQMRAQGQLSKMRAKHSQHGALGDDAEEDKFKALAAEESSTYSQMYQKLGLLSGTAAAKLHALQQGASSFVEDGARADAARADAHTHFTGLYADLMALKKGADAEVQKLTHRIVTEKSSLLQSHEIDIRQHFEDLGDKIHDLKQHTAQQEHDLEQGDVMAAMNAGPASLLQGPAAPSSLLENPLAKRLESDFKGSSKEFAAKISKLQAKTTQGINKLISEEDDVPFPGAPTSLLEESAPSPALDRAFANAPAAFRARMQAMQAQTEKQLRKLSAEERVPVPSSLLEGAPGTQEVPGHDQFERVLKNLKQLKADTNAKLAKIAQNAHEPSLLEVGDSVDAHEPSLHAKLKEIQAAVSSKIQALESKTKGGRPVSLLETDATQPVPADLGQTVKSLEMKSRSKLESILGDKDLFQGHDLDDASSFLQETSAELLREPRMLLEKSDKVATQAATAGLEKQFHDAFRQGFSQGLEQAGAPGVHADPASFVEAPPADDPPMFAELDKVQAELKNLKSDVATNFDKVSSLVNSDGSLAQMRSSD